MTYPEPRRARNPWGELALGVSGALAAGGSIIAAWGGMYGMAVGCMIVLGAVAITDGALDEFESGAP